VPLAGNLLLSHLYRKISILSLVEICVLAAMTPSYSESGSGSGLTFCFQHVFRSRKDELAQLDHSSLLG
jgi:hypothetical protein